MGQFIRDKNEAAWAADRVERDRNPGPFDPVYFANPADVPLGLDDAWLLLTVCLVQPTVDAENSQNCLSDDDDWI